MVTNFLPLGLAISGVVVGVSATQAGPVLFDDEAAFRAAVGELQEIDFETLPDGSPSYTGAFITSEFNYTDQGVQFVSFDSDLFINGSPGGFGILSGPFDPGVHPRNWLIADPVEPAFAIGFRFPGNSALRVFDQEGRHILTAPVSERIGFGIGFAGITSFGQPIGWMELDRGGDSETITHFMFAPVPEPASIILLVLGMTAAVCSRRSS